jgi:hypothetical protein
MHTYFRRNKYVVEKFAKEFEDRDADTAGMYVCSDGLIPSSAQIDSSLSMSVRFTIHFAGELTQLKGHLDDTIDVDALNLYDLRKGDCK